jgi:NAD(P)-dependent dehydrogenase (short-subunit alcohol dehydrogenase family)
MLRALFALVLLPLFASSSFAEDTPAKPGAGRAVLITGASTGIGRKTAELLASQGFHVYACARKDADLAELGKIANVQAIRLDVTKPDEIAAAVETVRAAGRGLYGLVNNAGVAVFGPLIEMRDEDFFHQLEVNVHGPFLVTKAFAPLLIESHGRVTTTGSISGTIAWGMGGAYCASKHAVEAYTDALAAEIEPFGVAVSVVEPGNYRSDITASARQRLVESGAGGEGSRYKAQVEKLMQGPADRSQYKEPDEVAQAFLHALVDEHPKRRYMVVPNQGEAERTIRAALARVAELNRDQPYAYDREALVKMLDEALKAK